MGCLRYHFQPARALQQTAENCVWCFILIGLDAVLEIYQPTNKKEADGNNLRLLVPMKAFALPSLTD